MSGVFARRLFLALAVLTVGRRAARQPLAAASPTTVTAALSASRRAGATPRWLARIGIIVSPSGQEHERAAPSPTRRPHRADGRHGRCPPNVVGRIRAAPKRWSSSRRWTTSPPWPSTRSRVGATGHRGRPRRRARHQHVDGDGGAGGGRGRAAEGRPRPRARPVFAAVAQEETGLGIRRSAQWKDRAVAIVDVLGDGHSTWHHHHWWKVVASGPPGTR